MSSYEVRHVSAEEIEALMRAAHAERDRQVKEALVRAAKAVARFFRTVAEAVSEAYEAERKRTEKQASSVMRGHWASGD